MGFAISLTSDHPSANRIRDLWADVEQFEDQASMTLLGYPPHITFAIYDKGVSESEVRDALYQAGTNLRAVTLTFDAIRSFDGPPLVLWASPRPNAVLRAIHEAISTSINPALCRPHYRPQAWRPHCTLGTQVRNDRREAALAFASEANSVFDVTFDGLDCIYFPPIAPLEYVKLV